MKFPRNTVAGRKCPWFLLLPALLLWLLAGPQGATVWGQEPAAAPGQSPGLEEMSRAFAVENVVFRTPIQQFAGQPTGSTPTGPSPLPLQKSLPLPASYGPPLMWGSVHLADKRVVFLEDTLYALEMDFSGKRNTLAILDRTRELFGPRESVRGRFGLPSGKFDTVPQELIKEWKSPRLLAILTYWDNLEGGTLRIVDRERYEDRLEPQRERSREAQGRLSNSILQLDWGARPPVGGEEYAPDLPQQDRVESGGENEEAAAPAEDRSDLEKTHRGNRWPGSAVDDLFE